MDSFFHRFINQYFLMLGDKCATYKSPVRPQISGKLKGLFYYEKTLDWLTRKLSRNNYHCALIWRDNYFTNNIGLFENTYNLLGDDYSRSRYVEYISFKAVASNGVRLPLGDRDFLTDKKKVDLCRVTNDSVNDVPHAGKLFLLDLSSLGYDARLINDPVGTLIDFVYEQYAYKELLRVEHGDVVIDCGGASGDTAVYFSSKGASAVYVVEFIRSNLELIRKQIEINPEFKDKINIMNKPVWSISDVELSYIDKGNASRVADAGVYPNTVRTISIDDMVAEHRIKKVHFIKMDIEGAELPALKGAEKTIREHRPKLAICVYHKNDDLIEIPSYIQSLYPGYEFYFDCYTDIGWEAVLYAVDGG